MIFRHQIILSDTQYVYLRMYLRIYWEDYMYQGLTSISSPKRHFWKELE